MVAQAATAAAVQLRGHFTLGVGTGEALNEHILGNGWPAEPVRLEMLEEAVTVMRALWQGDDTSHRGRHYQVENARVYTRPEQPPAIYLSAFGDKSFDLALRIADGFITTKHDAERVRQWKAKAGPEKPTQGGYKVCVADTEDEGVNIAHRLWASAGLPGELSQVPPSPRHFEQDMRARHARHDPPVGRLWQGRRPPCRCVPAVRRRRVRRDLRREHRPALPRVLPPLHRPGPPPPPPAITQPHRGRHGLGGAADAIAPLVGKVRPL